MDWQAGVGGIAVMTDLSSVHRGGRGEDDEPGLPTFRSYLSDQFQPFEIFLRPMRLDLDHRPQCLDFEGLAGAVQNKTVPGQGRDSLTSRQAAQARVVDRHSDNYCHSGFAGHLHLIGWFGR